MAIRGAAKVRREIQINSEIKGNGRTDLSGGEDS
jgi:hypothetical protein